ncbi:MAG: Putative glycosyltransferase, partial [uncultured Chloroflexia bacterium]
MRIAIVVQRYGLDVHGGAEAHARVWAERLAARHHVEVLTTCARDYLTWADFYPAGRAAINGVQVQRFPVDAPRDIEAFNTFGHIVFGGPHTEEQELEWMRQQGPYSSELYAAISAQSDDFDLFIFMTYLYCTTFFGLPLVREKAVLVPTAHDEPPIYLRIFKQLFTAPRYIIYNTPSERSMLHRLFPIAHIPGREVGVGVDIVPSAQPNYEADPPTLLFIGRVHPSKGCDQLYEDFVRYRKATAGDQQPLLKLVFAGRADMTLPEHPDVEMLG